MFIDNFDLNTKATVKRITSVSDGMGGYTETTTTVANLKGAFWQNSAAEQLLSDKVSNVSGWSFACKPNDSILASDLIVIANDTYRVDKPNNVLAENEIMVIGLNLVD